MQSNSVMTRFFSRGFFRDAIEASFNNILRENIESLKQFAVIY